MDRNLIEGMFAGRRKDADQAMRMMIELRDVLHTLSPADREEAFRHLVGCFPEDHFGRDAAELVHAVLALDAGMWPPPVPEGSRREWALAWDGQRINKEVFGGKTTLRHIWGEVLEVIEAARERNLPGLREEVSDVATFVASFAAQHGVRLRCWLGQSSTRKFVRRNHTWETAFTCGRLRFERRYCVGGGNWRKAAKVEAALDLAALDQEVTPLQRTTVQTYFLLRALGDTRGELTDLIEKARTQAQAAEAKRLSEKLQDTQKRIQAAADALALLWEEFDQEAAQMAEEEADE